MFLLYNNKYKRKKEESKMKQITFKLSIPKESNLVNMCAGMVHHASEFTSQILLSVDNGNQIDLKSILGIMSLCMSNGKIITIDI